MNWRMECATKDHGVWCITSQWLVVIFPRSELLPWESISTFTRCRRQPEDGMSCHELWGMTVCLLQCHGLHIGHSQHSHFLFIEGSSRAKTKYMKAHKSLLWYRIVGPWRATQKGRPITKVSESLGGYYTVVQHLLKSKTLHQERKSMKTEAHSHETMVEME